MVTRDIVPLLRWARANGWTRTRTQAALGPCHSWRRGDDEVALVSWDGITRDGRQVAPDVVVWSHTPGTRDGAREVVRVDASGVDIVARVLVAVDLLPRTWRAQVTPRSRPRQIRGQLELIPA